MEAPDLHEGYWLSQWTIDDGSVIFAFAPAVHMLFPDEEAAQIAFSALKQQEIETRIVRLP